MTNKEDKILASEFEKYKMIHKLTIIQIAIEQYPNTIFINPLLDKYKDLDLEPREKGTFIVDDLYSNKEYDTIDSIYETAWQLVGFRVK